MCTSHYLLSNAATNCKSDLFRVCRRSGVHIFREASLAFLQINDLSLEFLKLGFEQFLVTLQQTLLFGQLLLFGLKYSC
jgi:hypothetical protein